MKKTILLLVLLSLAPFLMPDSAKEQLRDLPPQYRKWLQEEVVYIISDTEKRVFLQLASDQERDEFIKAFWRQRDPNPNTPQNEFRVEHYRRIQYANTWFGKESPGPGWRSDMGRIYIQLGEPKSIDRLENSSELRPVVTWYYQGMVDYGLPNAFTVMFFKRDATGDYQLYSPVRFGPQYLMVDYDGDMTDYESAFHTLYGIEPTIAELSLNLIAGESSGYSPSMSSELLITSKIPTAPARKVNTQYAEKMLRYKDMVEMEYTANYIDNAKLAAVIRDPLSGMQFVHYLIEPKRLSIEEFEGKFYTTLEVFGSVADMAGKTVFQINKTAAIELSREQMARIHDKLFSFQDMFPLVPGKYRLTVLLKNTVSREFTSMEQVVDVPAAPALGIRSLLLANRMIENSGYRGQSKPFLLGDRQLVPSPRNDFTVDDTLYAYCQLEGLSEELEAQGTLQFDILKDNVSLQSFSRKVGDYPRQRGVLEKIALAALKPANYVLRLTLRSPQGQALASEEADFYITPMPTLPRPWVVSLPLPASVAPQYWNDLGNQYLSLNETARAREHLERAYHLAPQTTRFILDFCRVLMDMKEFRQAKDTALLGMKSQERPELLLPLAQASQALGENAEAIDFYRRHISHAGASVRALNALGECYAAAGNAAEAAVTWEKSLKIDPKQETLKQRLADLKGGKK
jgi:GWxTD domain-containing protein